MNRAKGKGKGKNSGKYQWHRKALQQSRTSRGFDKPWLREGQGRDQQPYRTKMSLADIQKKTRCHNCKQVGHWSRDCPLRKKSPTSPSSTSSMGSPPGRTPMSGFSAGFFVSPPAEESSDGKIFHATQEPESSENYMVALCLLLRILLRKSCLMSS